MSSEKSTTDSDRLKTAIQYGHDDASDAKNLTTPTPSPPTSEIDILTLNSPKKKHSTIQPSSLPLLKIPHLTTGLSTFAHQRALQNRIKEPKLLPGSRYDLSKYPPIFLHDTLMLPGSLANLIGKGSPEDILNRLTPALLPAHHMHIGDSGDGGNKPSLTPSPIPNAYVQGILLFGQGKRSRDLIHRHYRSSSSSSPSSPQAKRKKLAVEIELAVLKPLECREHEFDFWELRQRTVYAYVWKLSHATEGCDVGSIGGSGKCPEWNLEGYLANSEPHSEELPMRIEASAKGDEDEDGWIGRDVLEFEVEVQRKKKTKKKKREVVYSGPGRLFYERVEGEG